MRFWKIIIQRENQKVGTLLLRSKCKWELSLTSLRWALWNPRKYFGASLECAFNCGQISLSAEGEIDVAPALFPGNKRCNLLFQRQSFDGGGKFSRARKQRNYIIRENTECKLHIGAQAVSRVYLFAWNKESPCCRRRHRRMEREKWWCWLSLYLYNHIHKCSRQRQSRLTAQEPTQNLPMQITRCIEEWKKS
jgi:hypothetical protein